jgi:hypothetical protein
MIRAALVMACGLLVLAPSAGATLRVETASSGALVLTEVRSSDENDTVTLSLVQANSGLEWTITRTCTRCAFDPTFELGPGCHAMGDTARCARQAAAVTVTMAKGNDKFQIGTSGLPITEPLSISLGDGDDQATGAAGNDTLAGNDGKDVLDGKAGNDNVQGGAGDDLLGGGDGNDTIGGSDGADRITPGLGADIVDAGFGADQISLGTPQRDGRDDVNGGIGHDTSEYLAHVTAVRIVEANQETLGLPKDGNGDSDVLRSIETYIGSPHGDVLTGALSSNDSNYFGGGGNDQIFGSSGDNTIAGGAGADELDGNAGDDTIDGKAGEGATAVADPVIDCGTGTNDRASLDLKDDPTPAGCRQENITRSAAGEGPHVQMKFGRVVAVGGDRLKIRLRCPRKLRHRCAGTLALRIGKARTPRTRYSIKAGRSQRVPLDLGALRDRIGRRTVGQLVSLERGRVEGVKTTQRRIVLAG